MVVVTSAVLVMVSAGISTCTVLAQRGSVPAAGQLFPGVAESTDSASTLFPVSGLLTVTDPVTVTDAPGARSPVQVTVAVAPSRMRLPAVLVASLL